MKNSKNIQLYFGCISLLIGSSIYILARSDSLLMFKWFNALGMLKYINYLRQINTRMSPVIVYNLPTALWLLAFIFFIRSIWKDNTADIYIYIIVLVTIISELLQIKKILPGTFDFMDLILIMIVVIIDFIINKKNYIADIKNE